MDTPFGELPNGLAVDMTMAEQHDWLARRVSRRTFMASAAGGLLLATAPDLWRPQRASGAAMTIEARHVSYGADPTAQLTVEFSTRTPFRQGYVDMVSGSGHNARESVQTQTVKGSDRYYSRATFTTLQPDQSYHYAVTLDGAPAGGGDTRTAPTEIRPFRFTAYGDQGEGGVQQAVINQVGVLAPAFNLMCGDLCYAVGGDGMKRGFVPKLWDLWLEQNDPVTQRVPFLSIPGNHEMEPGFGMNGYAGFLARVNPGGASPLAIPVATTMRMGNVMFIGLDSNDVSYEIPGNLGWTHGAQTTWLEQQLQSARSTPGIDFIVAFLHHSAYSTSQVHASEGGVIENWVPLFDRYSVDLVVSGHNHCYERTRPIRGGHAVDGDGTYASDVGTTYITAGGGGAGGDPPFIPYPNKTRVATAGGPEAISIDWSLPDRSQSPSVLCVDVSPATRADPATMHVRAVHTDGSLLDQVILTRGAAKGYDDIYIGAAAGLVVVGGGAVATTQFIRHRRSTN